MAWRGPFLSILLIGVVYRGVRPQMAMSIGLELYWALFIGLSIAAGIAAAFWHARRHQYTCDQCGHTFEASAGRHLLAQDWFGRLRTACPSCGQPGRLTAVPTSAE